MIKSKESSGNEIFYKLYKKPEDMGRLGLSLDWKNYLNDKPIAKIKLKDTNHLELTWMGFYNAKTKKRNFTTSDIKSNNQPVIY